MIQFRNLATQRGEAKSSENIKAVYLEKELWGGLRGPHIRAKVFLTGLGFSLKIAFALYFYKVNKEMLVPDAAATAYVFRIGAASNLCTKGLC